MEDRRTPVLLATVDDAARHLPRLRPRDCVFRVCEIPAGLDVDAVLEALAPAARLLVRVAAGPRLRAAVLRCLGDDPLAAFLGDRFPPRRPLPERCPEELHEIALGSPGEPVAHGLFPSVPTKLARLVLARSGAYPADAVRAAAEGAYDRGRPYHAHDALACALAHPGVDAADLAARFGAHTGRDRGWRSRHKTHEVIRWAVREGFHDLGA